MKKLIRLFKRALSGQKSQGKTTTISPDCIIPRGEHSISRTQINDNALKVLYRLHQQGYQSFLVGGSVRDLLLGREPKDFDIATDASPEQVRKLFRNCRLIGKRFRLAHVYFKDEIIEVATFRRDNQEQNDKQQHSDHGVLLRDNVYGNLEDDVWRRDFTVNAIYYNIADFSLVDYTAGLKDINKGVLRIIGNPKQRYREDPVRILRAIRFAAKLSFTIAPEAAAPIPDFSPLLSTISNARLFDETCKLFLAGAAVDSFSLLRKHNLLHYLFPITEQCLQTQEWHQISDHFIFNALASTDQRVHENKPVMPAFLFAIMLWYPLQMYQSRYMKQGMPAHLAFEKSLYECLKKQTPVTAIPKRLVVMMREIWSMHHALIRRNKKRIISLLHHPRFRAGYDFLLLTAEVEPGHQEIADWWTALLTSSKEEEQAMLQGLASFSSHRRKSRKKKFGDHD